jgi:hypothetical protein
MTLRYILLFIPWIFSMLFVGNPQASFLIAWFGSILNLILILSGTIKPLPNDLPISKQLIRPIFLTQILFVGYTCLTSIFFYLDVLGYRNFEKSPVYHIDIRVLEETAASQRLYILAHASYAFGLLALMRFKINYEWKLNTEKFDANFFLRMAILFSILKFLFIFIPGLSQFAVKAADIAYISSIIAIVTPEVNKSKQFYLISVIIFLLNFVQVLFSGWKEPIIFTLILMVAFLYPKYKRTVLIASIPALMLITFVLPSFNALFREQVWTQGVESSIAASSAIDAIQAGEIDVYTDNWEFLIKRSSEISMLNDYMRKVPKEIEYYGNQLIIDGFRFILPRIFWPDKPDIEMHVMQRVYKIGIVSEQMLVSAKPPIVVDAYISGGHIYVFIILFLFGALTSYISRVCEYLFCGYNIGTVWIFLGVFQIFNKGSCFEFMLNSIFWGIVTMFIILFFLKRFNYIIPYNQEN